MVTARQLIIGTKPGDVVVLVKKGTRANQHLVLLAETRNSIEVKDMGFGTDCLVFTFLKLLKNGKDA